MDFTFDDAHHFGLLAVGSPGRSLKGSTLAGGVTLFKIDFESLSYSRHLGMINTDNHPARLGKQVRFYTEELKTHLFVSAPSYTPSKKLSVSTEQGMLYVFNNILQHVLDSETDFHLTTDDANSSFTTDERTCRHGDTLAVKRNLLVVGSPLCMNGKMRNSGRVYVLDAGDTLKSVYSPF